MQYIITAILIVAVVLRLREDFSRGTKKATIEVEELILEALRRDAADNHCTMNQKASQIVTEYYLKK